MRTRRTGRRRRREFLRSRAKINALEFAGARRVEFDSLGIGERDHHLRNGALGGHHGTGLSAYGERTETSGVEIGSELAAVLTLRGER